MSEQVKHGRRAKGGDDEGIPEVKKGWSEKPVVNEKEAVNLPTLDAGVDESIANAPRQEEDLSREVAAAPTEYHSAMPKLSELAANNRWALLRPTGVDLSVLIATLSNTLDDEDVTWYPNQLLVQLNSELLDAADKKDNENATLNTSPTASTAPDERRSRRAEGSPRKEESEKTKSSSDLKKESSVAKEGRRSRKE